MVAGGYVVAGGVCWLGLKCGSHASALLAAWRSASAELACQGACVPMPAPHRRTPPHPHRPWRGAAQLLCKCQQ